MISIAKAAGIWKERRGSTGGLSIGMSAPDGPKLPEVNDFIPMNESYANFSSTMGPLGTTEASIFWQYSCQSPEKRSTATVFLLVVVADFVLLQTAWMIMIFVADHFESKRPRAMWCEGCIEQGHGLVSIVPSSGNNTLNPSSTRGFARVPSRSLSSSTRALLQPEDHDEGQDEHEGNRTPTAEVNISSLGLQAEA